MSLDQNLFTLHFTQNKDNPNVIDLVDPSGTIHYRRHRIPGQTYKIEVYDPTSEALLATATGTAGSSKHKTLELYNPTLVIELKYTGTLVFRWSFKWEDHEFEWKREECYMIRKPDPPVMVAVTKEPPGKIKTTAVQILDYNLNRFDINDRKGLEITILTALLTFQDFNEPLSSEGTAKGAKVSDAASVPSTNPVTTAANIPAYTASTPVVELMPPPPPPKPAPKTGVDRIAEIQAMRDEVNEVVVEDEGAVHDYAQYCFNLLQDDAMLFVTVKSASAGHVPKVLQVVEEAKRLRHKNGQDDDELYQYVRYDTEREKGPRRINLDDDNHNKNMDKYKYKPPNSLTVHLSKIPIPELQPKAQADERKGKGESSWDTRKKDHGSNNHNTNSSSPPSLSVPKPSVLSRRKRSSANLPQTNRPPSHSPPTNSHKNSEPGSPHPAGSPYPSTSSRQSYPPQSVSLAPQQTQAPPPPPRVHTQPPPERPVSTNFLFDFLRR